MKKLTVIISILAVMFTAASCTKDNCDEAIKDTVAVILPSGELNPKWSQDAPLLESAISRYGYKVKTYVAIENSDGIALQIEQVREVIKSGIKHIVITPIDDEELLKSGVLDRKDDLDIICYDRMIRNCDVIDYYIGCNQTSIGNMQGHFILQYFKAIDKTPMTIELFAGPESDNNSQLFFNGATSLINPYINNGSLIVPSNKKEFSEVSLPSWKSEDAKAEMAARIKATGVIPDFILATNDMVADGVIKAIRESGHTGKYPVITGLDNVKEARENILYGYQTMTIDKDLVPLTDNAAMVINSIISGSPIKTSYTVDNGAKDVPTFYSSISLVTFDDLKN